MTDSRIENKEWPWIIISSGLLILLTLLPYLWAYGSAVPNHRFMGILVNPIDGQSYIAKMYQGFRGDWFYHLPYTSEDHRPVFFFTFYLFLGHLARWLRLSLELVFHTARVIGSLFMLLMLYVVASDWTDDVLQRRITWGLTAVGSGLGWLVLVTGHIAPDLTIPEAFPLYAAYANPHFPWTIAVIAYIAHVLTRTMLDEEHARPGLEVNTFGLVAGTLFTAATQPFALLPLGAGVGTFLAWRWLRLKRLPRRELSWALVVLISSLPLLLYGFWAVSEANPIFHAWYGQNKTPSPPPWDYLLAFGPLLSLAALAIWKSWPKLGDGEHDGDILLLGWLVLNALLLYAPMNLQRRLTIGLIIPLGIFAGRGLARVILPVVRLRWRPLILAGTFILAAPSSVIVLVLPLQGTLTLDEHFYITQAERASLDWLHAHAAPSDVVLASPSYSLYVPAYGGARVFYGHPFETISAEERSQAVTAFYQGEDCDLPDAEGVKYIVFGRREEEIGNGCRPDAEPQYDSSGIAIYQTSS